MQPSFANGGGDMAMKSRHYGTRWYPKSIISHLNAGCHIHLVQEKTIQEAFPRLFSISNQKEERVGGLVNHDNGSGWKLTFRIRLFSWEEDSLQDLLNLIEEVQMDVAIRDRL